jgi:sugar phosphate isomerase/epimerase
MPRFGLATLNHSPLFGLTTQWEAHLDAAREAGFDALAPDLFWLRALEAEGVSLESVSEAMSERGLACMEIAGLTVAEESETRDDLEENLRYARVFQPEFVNARLVVPPSEAARRRLQRCADALASTGTRIALEFSNGSALRDIAQAQGFLESLELEPMGRHARGFHTPETSRIGLTLDTWHFFQAEGGPDWRALETLPHEALANVQLSDGTPRGDREYSEQTMHHRLLPGAGEFDLARCARWLHECDYDGAVIIEVLNAEWRAAPLSDFAQQSADGARAWWG